MIRIALVTTGDPANNPRLGPLVTVLRAAGHDVTLVSPPVPRPVPGVAHVQAQRNRWSMPLLRRFGPSVSSAEAVAREASKLDPEIVYPLRAQDVEVAEHVGSGWVLSRPGWPQPSERDFIGAGPAVQNIVGDWRLEGEYDLEARPLAGTTFHIVARYTTTSPSSYLANAFERCGASVVRHEGVLDWTVVSDDAAGVLIVESPYPEFSMQGIRANDVPVVFWVHHGEHHQPASLRLADRYGVDAIVLGHSWHLAHQFRHPVYTMPYAVPIELVPAGVAFAERPVDVAMIASGMNQEGWYSRRKERADNIRADHTIESVFGYGMLPHDMMDLYGRTKLVINDGGAQHFPITMRVFESTGAGAVLATEPQPGLEDLYTAGEHFVYIESTQSSEIRDLLADPAMARVADAGRRRTLEVHRYEHRALRMAEIVAALDAGAVPTRSADLSDAAAAVDADVEPQSILIAGDVDMGSGLPDRDVRRLGPEDSYGDASFDALVIGPGAPVDAVDLARMYVYVADPVVLPAVRERLPEWDESTVRGVARFDSGWGGYRLRPEGHPLR